jgi:hypothetical protein
MSPRLRFLGIYVAAVSILFSANPARATLSMSATAPANTLATALILPTGLLQATVRCEDGEPVVELDWTPSGSDGTDGYLIRQAGNSGGAGVQVGEVGGGELTFTDRSVGFGSSVYYTVITKARAWTSQASVEAEASTPSGCP